MEFTKKQRDFLTAALTWGEKNSRPLSKLDKHDLQAIADSAGMKFPHWITRVPTYKVGRGLFRVPVDGKASSSVSVVKPVAPAAVKPPPPAVAVPAPVV